MKSNESVSMWARVAGRTAILGALAAWSLGCGALSPGVSSESDKPKRDPGEMLQVGETAPPFALEDHTGRRVALKDFRGKQNVVLIFYPGDATPGCTRQLCAVRDDYSDFEAAQVAVFGVNPQSAESHRRFAEKQRFPFPLLVDTERRVAAAYGCQGVMIQRTVYGINKEGVIVFAQRGMPANKDILAAFPPPPAPAAKP